MTDAPAIPAATLVVVRDKAGSPPELLMVERSATMVFAPGMMVFPGGRIDAADVALGERLDHPLGAAIVAAVRETLEEAAVPVALNPLPSPELALEFQRALLAERPFTDLLDEHRLTLDPEALTRFARWLPRGHVHRRFDTLFFLAQAPPGAWQPHVGEAENRSAEWMTAEEVLERERRGTAGMIFPTRCNVRRLARHRQFTEMLVDAATYPKGTISPLPFDRDGEIWVSIPEGLGYPPTAEPLGGGPVGSRPPPVQPPN